MKIFLIIPFTPEFEDIEQTIGNAVGKGDQLISLNGTIGIIDTNIKEADLVIADVSDNNPNVIYILGFAQSLKRPILPIIRKGETIPFDIASMRTLIYDRNRLNDTLSIPLRNYLSHPNFEKFLEKDIAEYIKEKKKIKTVFVSYSHVDTEYLERLIVHLKPFEKKGLIDLWVDTKIKVGEKWKEKIETALKRSAIAILLISADFLASDFIIDNELPPLLKSAEEKGKIIVPVIVKPCRFTKEENLSIFQSINDPKIPLSKMDENGKEEIYVKIADYIDKYTKRK
ncbi:MAG: toll/interleukin-1 receptor domain-containing protein [Candidatus Tenebribacter burtonii]|jgi:hypothetical protein|nr:toll/interleukin-1 receptor domain-containing protein [Candidatus Tenebribacter burtonii]